MKRRDFFAVVGGVASAVSFRAPAQAQAKPVIGFLNTGQPNDAVAPLLKAFLEALGAAGYKEGDNLSIEYRWAEGRYDRIRALAAELVDRKVLLIAATGGTVAAKATMAATSTVPILFIAGFDPVQEGLVSQINRPGGNATGVGVYSADLGPKRLALLKELLGGRVRSLAMLVNPDAISTGGEVEEIQFVADSDKTPLSVLQARNAQEIELAFSEAAKRNASALLISADSFFTSQRTKIVILAALNRLPVCYPWPQYVEAGGLISYGTNLAWAYQQIGTYAGRILKGDKASNLPVQFPTTFQTAINLSTARALGLAVPTTLLSTADVVVE